MDEIVERAKRGDPAAVEALLSDIAPRVQRFGLRLCGNAHDADDVLQDTLLSVTQHIAEFEGRSSLASWVFALARSACTRRRRGQKNAPPRAEVEGLEQRDSAPTPEAHAAGREVLDALLDALQALPAESREVILLRDVEGLSATETAVALGVSTDAVKSRLHRARHRLRERLRPILEPEAVPACARGPAIMDLWSQKLEGELSQEDCAQMEEHLGTCPSCDAACSALRQALLACHHASATAVPAEVQTRVKEAVLAWARQRPSG